MNKWTEIETKTLIDLYGEGLSFSQMRDRNELMKARYLANPMGLRDKIYGLQKERIKNGEGLGPLSRPLTSEKYDYRVFSEDLARRTITVRGKKENDDVELRMFIKRNFKEECLESLKNDPSLEDHVLQKIKAFIRVTETEILTRNKEEKEGLETLDDYRQKFFDDPKVKDQILQQLVLAIKEDHDWVQESFKESETGWTISGKYDKQTFMAMKIGYYLLGTQWKEIGKAFAEVLKFDVLKKLKDKIVTIQKSQMHNRGYVDREFLVPVNKTVLELKEKGEKEKEEAASSTSSHFDPSNSEGHFDASSTSSHFDPSNSDGDVSSNCDISSHLETCNSDEVGVSSTSSHSGSTPKRKAESITPFPAKRSRVMLPWTTEAMKILVELSKKNGVNWKNSVKQDVNLQWIYENHVEGFKTRLKAVRSGKVFAAPSEAELRRDRELKKERVVKDKVSDRASIIKCPGCTKDLSSTHLLTVGLSCSCLVDPDSLMNCISSHYDWAVYIIQERKFSSLSDPVEYVGVTNNLKRRSSQHKTRFSQEIFKILVSVEYGENLWLRMLKPLSNVCQLGGKEESKLNWDFKEMFTVVNMEEDRKSRILAESLVLAEKKVFMYPDIETYDPVGIVYSYRPIYPVNLKWCYKYSTQDSCQCKIPCTLRRIWNQFRKDAGESIEVWHPLRSNEVRENIRSFEIGPVNIRRYNGVSKNECARTKEFFCEVVVRNESLKASSMKAYQNEMSALFSNDLIKLIDYPELLCTESRKIYPISSFCSKLNVINVFFTNLTLEETKKIFSDLPLSLIVLLRRKYKNMKDSWNELSKKVRASGLKSKSQEENWSSWSELENLLPRLFEEAEEGNLMALQRYVGFKLQVKQQTLRNDYGTLKYRDYSRENDNYIDMEKKVFVWNSYKTDKYHGQLIFGMNGSIFEDLRELISHQKDSVYVFTKRDGSMMGKDYFGTMISGITEKYLGKRIGSRMMRTIALSEMYKDAPRMSEMSEKARSMMHTVSTAMRDYVKF